MPQELLFFIAIISLLIIGSPMYLQNRKISRIADEDLKKINYDEWKKQFKSNIYIKMFSRIIWGLFILSGFIFNFSKIYAFGFQWVNVIVLLFGIGFIVWGIIAFRREIKQVQNLK